MMSESIIGRYLAGWRERRRRRQHARKVLRAWRRKGPAEQLAFFIQMFDAEEPTLRERFRGALRVRGIRDGSGDRKTRRRRG
jgi:hypothetical protein